MSEQNYCKLSCDMIRVADDDAVFDGPPGSFCIVTRDDGHRIMWFKGPGGSGGMILLRPTSPSERDRPSWEWGGDEDKPTLHPSVHSIGHWHGWFRDGRMQSC